MSVPWSEESWPWDVKADDHATMCGFALRTAYEMHSTH